MFDRILAELDPGRPFGARLRWGLRHVLAVAALVGLAAWGLRFLGARLHHVDGVRQLGERNFAGGPWTLGLVALGLALASLRLRGLGTFAGPAWGVLLAVAGLSLTFELGHLVLIVGLAAALGGVLAGTLPEPPRLRSRSWDRWAPRLLFGLAMAAGCVFSMHRHWAFGSGSWDLGCYVHNFYRVSRGLDSISTVLGGVDFLGDHFSVGLYLFAPLFWLDASAYMVLAVQSASLAVTGPAIYGIARARGLDPELSTALGLATGLGFGLQSAFFFDAHAITVGFGFLAAGLWALETRRLWLATVLLVLFSTFKESLGAYVVGLGLLLLWRGWRRLDRRSLAFGLGWVVYGGLWFVVVNRVFMPWLIARGRPPEPHETFADFGPTVFAAVLGLLSDPMKGLGAMFVPDEKALSLGVTLAGVAGLALAAPEVGLAALPLLAERFLSSKASMWQMGYHYAAPLTLYAGWAAALGYPRVAPLVDRWMALVAPDRRRLGARAAAIAVLAAWALVAARGYRHPSNFLVWRESYFADDARRSADAAAVAFVREMGRDVKVAAQNRLLPHLADRAQIWRLGDHAHADVVVLSLGESAWPYSDAFPGQLARRFESDAGWTLVFSEGPARVFARAPEGAKPRSAADNPLPSG